MEAFSMGHSLGGSKGSQAEWSVKLSTITRTRPGGRLNKKDGLTRYGDSHVKDKTS